MIKYFLNIVSYIFYRILNSQTYVEKEAYLNRKYLNQKCKFKLLGENIKFPKQYWIKNPQYISIGNNFSSLYNLRIEAWDEYEGDLFTPEISIGNNVIMNTDIHIGAIDRVSIGDNVLLASRIYISDHYHGEITAEGINVAPVKRPLKSKGPVIIEDNVWIGEGACILSGVTIGKNSIIGANAVVNKNIPENSVAVGVPAKIIKNLR